MHIKRVASLYGNSKGCSWLSYIIIVSVVEHTDTSKEDARRDVETRVESVPKSISNIRQHTGRNHKETDALIFEVDSRTKDRIKAGNLSGSVTDCMPYSIVSLF